MDATLPKVVEFDHLHTVKVINDGTTTRIIATPNPKWKAKAKKIHDLPFTGKPANWDRWCWWFFPKAESDTEAEERGAFFWNEFVEFARGTQKRRAEEAETVITYALDAMRHYPEGSREAYVFRKRLAAALVAHLRVGVES